MPKFEDMLLRYPYKSKKYIVIVYSINHIDHVQTDLDSLVQRGNLMDTIIDNNANIGTFGCIRGFHQAVTQAFRECMVNPFPERTTHETYVVKPDGEEFQITHQDALRASRKLHFLTNDHGIRYWILKRYTFDKEHGKQLTHLYYVFRFCNPNYRKD